jgi:hypothetical protein
LEPGDELIVAVNNDGQYGARAIDKAQQRALGDRLLYCDDDDVFVPGALGVIRAWADANPSAIGIFRRDCGPDGLQWCVPSLEPRGNIQRMCLCIPNLEGRLPQWEDTWTEALIPRQAAELQDAEIVFVDHVIGRGRPVRNPVTRLRRRLRVGSRLRALYG